MPEIYELSLSSRPNLSSRPRLAVRPPLALKLTVGLWLIVGLSACGAVSGLDSLTSPSPLPAPLETTPLIAPPETSNLTIGSGPTRVALILPLSSQNGALAATGIRNAAELALSEFQSQDVTILVKDDKGTIEGAQAAARDALADGAEIILGPLFAPSVQAAAAIIRPTGKQMIAFSSDESVASRGVYLLSFLPQSDVDRIIGFAAQKGKKSFAILAPDGAYGNVASQDFQNAVNRVGGRVAAMERYAPGGAGAAAQRLKASIGTADALFIPEDGANLSNVAQALAGAGISASTIQILGTGIWNQISVFRIAQFQGAWFAAPDSEGFNSFAARYRTKFGQNPTRLSTLGFDAAALVAALTKTQGTQRFQENVLTNPLGYSGQDGVFRFRSDGTSERALAVFQIGIGRATIISPAPKGFAKAN